MSNRIVTCRDVMNNNFAIVDGLTSVADALKVIKQHNYFVIIIQKRNEFDEWGQVQLSDIAKKVIAKDRSPDRVNCYEIMAKPVVSVRPEMNIKYCARLFEAFGLSCAPVIEDQKIIGMVNYNDIVLNWLDLYEEQPE